MRIIDLLSKIASGEKVPKKIKVNKIIYEYQGDDYLYKDEDGKEYWLFSVGYTVNFMWLDSFLNTEVEILEEEKKIPEKLTPFETPFLKGEEPDIRFRLIIDQINEIIDYLQSKGE